MIPIRNRKKTLKVTVEEMRNFAFSYVEKYAPDKIYVTGSGVEISAVGYTN